MKLAYDPAQGQQFWKEIRQLPGFPIADAIPLRSMLIEEGAVFKLPAVLQSLGVTNETPLLVVMDPTPMRRGSQSLKLLVLSLLRQAGWEVRDLVLQPDQSGQVHTDMPHIEAVRHHLNPNLTVLSVGSGVVTDITKHASYLYKKDTGNNLPFVVFQTANSVSAFTSNMAPVFVEGIKRTLDSRYPDALVCDLETLRDAPYDMTAAGVGDLLALFVSLPDWELACRLGMDTSCTRLPQALMGPLDEIILENAASIRERSLEGMALLAKLISLGGLVMSLSHATTPYSGYEHVMSHILDLLNELRGKPLPQHGTQVALACVVVAEAYREFLENFKPARMDAGLCFPSVEMMRQQILENFAAIDPSGKAGPECWADYRLKLEKWHTRHREVQDFFLNWEGIKAEILPLVRTPERLKELLEAVNSPLTFAQMLPPAGEDDVRYAFFNAPLMRKRLTLGDLLIFFQWDREEMWPRIWEKTQG